MAFKELYPGFFCNIEDITGFGLEYNGYFVHLQGTKVSVPDEEEAKVTTLLTKESIPSSKMDIKATCFSCADWVDCRLADKAVVQCVEFKSIPRP